MILIRILNFLAVSSAMPTGYRNDYQDTAPCSYVSGCFRNGQFWNFVSRGQNRHSASPVIRETPFNRPSYVAGMVSLGLLDFIATGFQALFSEVLGNSDPQPPVYLHRHRGPAPQYELFVMRDNNVYIMPVSLQKINYGEQRVSAFGTSPLRNDLSGGTQDITLNTTASVVLMDASSTDLQINSTEENEKSRISASEFLKATEKDDRIQQAVLVETSYSESGTPNDISLAETDNPNFISGQTSTKDENFLESESPSRGEQVDSTYSERDVSGEISLSENKNPEVTHGQTSTKDKSFLESEPPSRVEHIDSTYSASDISLPENENPEVTRDLSSTKDESFLESHGSSLVQPTGKVESSNSKTDITSDISLPDNEHSEFLHGLTTNVDESVVLGLSPEETEIAFVDLTRSQEPGSAVKEQVGYLLAETDNIDSSRSVQDESNVSSRKQEHGLVTSALKEHDIRIPEKDSI